MFTSLLKLWNLFPVPFQDRIYLALKPTGFPYFISYIAKYKEAHRLSNFAGNILSVREEYLLSPGCKKKLLSHKFDAIIDSLVMKNGVKKTTYAMRQNSILSNVFSEKRCRIEKDKIKILDIPSSIGTASLDILEMLSKYYTISSYVLGDLYFKIYYDKNRECIYDEEGNLLQVKFRKQFFSIYRPNTSGDVFHGVAYCLLLPLSLISWYLKRKYTWAAQNNFDSIILIHPDVEDRLKSGELKVMEIDVFKEIEEKFDIIISFNLLQKNYFSDNLIRAGIENLKNALNEDGLLIMGNTESFSVSKKIKGELQLIGEQGKF